MVRRGLRSAGFLLLRAPDPLLPILSLDFSSRFGRQPGGGGGASGSPQRLQRKMLQGTGTDSWIVASQESDI